jgi:ketosteroid isomerase-like protein
MNKIIGALILFASCNTHHPGTGNSAVEEITKTDLAMSDMATKDGFFKALLHYAEDGVTIPREGKLPLMSKLEATAAWADKPVITELTWKPVKVEISAGGDMGYTFGFSSYKTKDTTAYTTYCTIWRKQKDGSWKFIFDGGNSIPNPYK